MGAGSEEGRPGPTEGECGGGRWDWQSGNDLRHRELQVSTIFSVEKKFAVEDLWSKKRLINTPGGTGLLAYDTFRDPREFCRRLRQRCPRIEDCRSPPG